MLSFPESTTDRARKKEAPSAETYHTPFISEIFQLRAVRLTTSLSEEIPNTIIGLR